MSEGIVVGRALSSPDAWNRYYRVETDIEPLIGTPGIEANACGETVTVAHSTFIQAAESGFFLRATGPVGGDPALVSAALAGVSETSGAFASVSGSRIKRTRQSATGTHIQFEQLIRGARVVGADSSVHQDTHGVFAITGRPMGDLSSRDPGPAPRFDPQAAISICVSRFNIEPSQLSGEVSQVIFPRGDGAVWAYDVGFTVPDDGADVRVYLEAEDLSLLLSYNIASSAIGRATVYPVNPLQDAAVQAVNLNGLDDPGNLLRGTGVDVSQASGGRLDRPDRDFRIDPAEPGFDEAQAYHHLWLATEYFTNLAAPGFMNTSPFAPMVAQVNDPRSPNNAYYSPSTGQLRFGLFGPRSSARSAAIVYHEFGHAVSDATCRLGRSAVRNTQARGLSEGFSDYFAASILNDPRLGDYVVNNPLGARNCSDRALRFPNDYTGEEHDTGAVWAAVLWSIRQQIGAAITDRVVLESLNFLGPGSSFDDARVALHTVDERLNGNTHRQLIDDEFTGRAPA